MKNGLLIWNVVLTLVAGYLLVAHFTSKKSRVNETKAASKLSAASVSSPFRIAYFEMDSIESNLFLVKDLRLEMNKREEAMDREMDALRKNFQQKFDYYQSQAKAGSMTPAQSEAANQEMRSTDEAIRNRKQELEGKYNDFVNMNQNDIKTKIKDFLKEYNADKNYSYIVANDLGFLYYKDSAYNITADVIKGLNEMYKSKKQ
jgi:outer membrane protein